MCCRDRGGPPTLVSGGRLHVLRGGLQAAEPTCHPFQLLAAAADDL